MLCTTKEPEDNKKIVKLWLQNIGGGEIAVMGELVENEECYLASFGPKGIFLYENVDPEFKFPLTDDGCIQIAK